MQPIFFSNQAEFRKWFIKNHLKEKELLVGFYKVTSKNESITWPQSVDEALCFGWIDGIRKSLDEESYTIRFTPRRPSSIWSTVNLKKMEALLANNLVQPAGIEAFNHRKLEKTGIYSHENEAQKLDNRFEKVFRQYPQAWEFFKAQAPSYQKVMIHWIMNAKQESTQLSRLEKTIAASKNFKRIT